MPDENVTSVNETGLVDAFDLPIIVIGRDCKIVFSNRAARTVLGVTDSDVGCSLGNTFAGAENLDKLCAQVMADGVSYRRETRQGDKTFLLRIAPYTGSNSQTLGALLTFTNVTAFRASIDQAIYEREYTKAILNTVTDPLVVLDAKLQVQTANRAFYALFGISRDETQGISIRKIGNSEWETSEVWEGVETTVSDDAEHEAVEIEREFPRIGRRTMVLEARRLTRDGDALILLAFRDITEAKQAQRITSLLAAIVDFSDDAIASKKLDGTITSWNKSAERLFGYTAEEAIGQRITLIVPWERRSEEEDILRRLAQGERFHNFETVRRRKDGSTVDVSLTISPIRDSAGKVVGASTSARDVSDRKRVERALRESEERFRAIVETTPECVKLVSADGTVLHMNSPGLEMVGARSADEVVGKNVYDLIAPEDRARFKAFNESICQGEQGSIQFDVTGLDGKRRHMESHAAPLRNSDGTVVDLAVTADISERKRAEQALQESEQRYRAVTEAAPIMVWMSGLDKLCYYFNRGWLDFVGRTLEEETGNGWAGNVHPDDLDRCVQIYVSSFDARSSFEMQYRLRHHSGQYRWILDHAVPRYAPDGTFQGYVGGCLDIHDQKEAEEKARRADVSIQLMKSQDEERRHIARELHDSAGQTLTVLGINLARLVQKTGRIAPELASEAEQIQEIVQQLHREIRTTSYLLHPPLLDENGLYSAITWYAQGLLERSGLEVRLDISPDFGRLPRDMELVIFRFVQECLTNIHRHSGSNTASIRIAQESNQITLEIQDQGKGMSPARLAEIQAGRSGMGIRGMRERLRQFEGTLNIQSESSGTCVSATIPVPKAASSEDDTKPEPLQAAIL